MKVKMEYAEVKAYELTLEVEREGEQYQVRVSYDNYDGYITEFYTLKGDPVDTPEWATEWEKEDMSSIGYLLEEAANGCFEWQEASK